MPPPEFDRSGDMMGDKHDRLLQIQRPGNGGNGQKTSKPDKRPDAPPTDLGQGAGLGPNPGNNNDD